MSIWQLFRGTAVVIGLVVALAPTERRELSRPKNDWDSQAFLMRSIGLLGDVNDQVILNLLADKQRRIIAMGLIAYRKMSAAIPELLYIARDPNGTMVEKIAACQTLLQLGNKEWVPLLRPLIVDPNSEVFITDRVKAAGLLAQSGDYSGVGILTKNAADPRYFVRSAIATELPHFVDMDSLAKSAVDRLYELAVSDPHPIVRAQALRSLAKVVGKKAELKSMLTEAAKKNVDSNDVVLRTTARYLLLQATEDRRLPKVE